MKCAVPSRLSREEALDLGATLPLYELMQRAASLRDLGFGRTIT
jgi:hypothetical protein